MNTPFYDSIAAVAQRGPRFFVPGHKGQGAAIPLLGDMLRWDLTEVEGAGDLSHPAGPLLESQRNMARAFGVGASLYSAFGATSCIGAMLALFCPAGSRVAMALGNHVSALRAAAFLGLDVAFLPLEAGRLQPATLKAFLKREQVSAVYLTSPDYYGRMADVAALAAACHRHGTPLLVDNAHGAHLRFGAQNRHPVALGAAASADSAHKTLPCLTPAALLQLGDAALEEAGRAALNLFCSTSPAYPVLISLDLAAGRLLEGELDFAGCEERVAALRHTLGPLCPPCDDPLRLVLEPEAVGIDPAAFHSGLLAAGIAPEFFDGHRLVLMATPCNSPEDFEKLEATTVQLLQTIPHNYTNNTPMPPFFTRAPTMACTVRQALFAPKQSLPLAAAEGRVMAGLDVPCPPGVPLAVPGQRLDAETLAQLAAGGILRVDVVK